MKSLIDKLKADLELAEKATPGPWEWNNEWKENGIYTGSVGELSSGVLWYGMDGAEGIYSPNKADSQLIAASRTRWPATTRALIKAIEALNAYKGMQKGIGLGQVAEIALAEIEKELK